MPSRCTVSHHRPGRALPERRPGHQRGRARGAVAPAPRPSPAPRRPGIAGGDLAGLGHGRGHPHPATVVAAADRLDHHGPADAPRRTRRRRRASVDLGDSAAPGAPRASSRRRMTSLSCACTSACGGGATLTPSATSFSSSSVGHVLVVEGQHVGARGDPAQRVEVGVRADHHVGADLRGRFVGRGGQHPQASGRARSPPGGSSGRAGRRRPWRRPGARGGGGYSARPSWCHGALTGARLTGGRRRIVSTLCVEFGHP